MLDLRKVLEHFGIDAQPLDIKQGPTVTRCNLRLNGKTRLRDLEAIADDLALYLKVSGVVIVPVPEKGVVSLEIPNEKQEMVLASGIVNSEAFHTEQSKLSIPLGRDVTGEPVILDLEKLPHLLVAGSTGSGKSCLLNTIIYGILNKAKVDEVKFILIDPKMVEFTQYKGLPHFVRTRYIAEEPELKLKEVPQPIINNAVAVKVLEELVKEVEYRYNVLKNANVNSIAEYLKTGRKMPYIVCIIDEVADLVLANRHKVIDLICKLAQRARSAGVHLVLATQRPSVDIITGSIKANFPNRIAFQVASRVDSNVILDAAGAEKLIGKGDLLFKSARTSKLVRMQSAYIKPEEITTIVKKVIEEQQKVAEDLECAAVTKAGKETPDEYIGVFAYAEFLFKDREAFLKWLEEKEVVLQRLLAESKEFIRG